MHHNDQTKKVQAVRPSTTICVYCSQPILKVQASVNGFGGLAHRDKKDCGQ